MKKRNLALTVVLLAVFATLALLRVSGTINAQTGQADKAVLEVILDRADAYPNMGTEINTHFPFVIHPGQPQTLISVTSLDALLAYSPGSGPLDSQVAFYADIPVGCYGRWWDKATMPPRNFPWDIYSIHGQPTAPPLSPEQLGEEVLYPPAKVPGDVDINPPVLQQGLPVVGQTFEVDVHFKTLQYGIEEVPGLPIPLTRFFDFHCDPGKYVFWFCNKIEPLQGYIDPSPWPGNNVLCAPFQVTASTGVGGIAEAPDAEASPVETGGGSSAATFAMAGGAAALLVVLAAGGWYARRRLRAS
ncbi:MAG: hypothetical protein MUP15_10710 [Dehalococcoidia bacterium]|nr:hypothetical protein [Dehalococcoidia bacterium]